MPTHHPTIKQPTKPTNFARAAVQIFAANERMNQLVIKHLDPVAWGTTRAKKTAVKIKAKPASSVRTIVAIFTHMHNVRCKWIRLSAPHLKVPPQLHRAHCTPQQARAGLAESAACCADMLAEALSEDHSGVKKFLRDGWAKPWLPGPEMLCYMLAHEAHHRGQVLLLAHQLGFPLPKEVNYGLWNWDKLWKECGSPRGPGENI